MRPKKIERKSMVEQNQHVDKTRVVIVGGGFGGLAAAKALAGVDAHIVLLDKRNYTLFQPLLYQIATAALSPGSIAAPIRDVVAKQKNARAYMGEVTDLDLKEQTITVESTKLQYDYLILATGVETNYFGNDWSKDAPGLKTIEEAIDIRNRFLLAFEQAEVELDLKAQRAALTFAIVGAGPTGVELAGAMAEMARNTLRKDFHNIDTGSARILLIDAGSRILQSFHENLSKQATNDLEELGVEILLNTQVVDVDTESIVVEKDGKREKIDAHNIIWAAGVKPSFIAERTGASLNRGKIPVDADLSLEGYQNVFAIGDLAHYEDPKMNQAVPGVAQGAIQMGKFVGKFLAKEIKAKKHKKPIPPRPTFHYFNKGSMAIIGRFKAVAEISQLRFGGAFAFLLWAFIHILFLVGFRRKLVTFAEWIWMYFLHDRGVRLITHDDATLKVIRPQEDPRLSERIHKY